MNHRDRQAHSIRPNLMRFAVAAAVLLSPFAGTVASAQRAAIPADLKAAADAKPRAAEIAAFITQQVKTLGDPKKDDKERQRARDTLLRESGPIGAVPSPSYLQVYASTLDAQLVPLAKSPSPRTRLLAAITLQRVAKSAQNTGLTNAATAFVQDASPGVALWAMKGSQSILPYVAAAGKPSKLPPAIVAGVRKHDPMGDLAEEAYRALTLDVNTKLVTPPTVPVLAPSVLEMYKYRVNLYVTQTPPRPELEQRATNFLTLAQVMDTKTGEGLRPDVMQQIANLIGLAAQHAAARDEGNRKAFVDQIRGLGDALVLMDARATKKNPELAAAGKALTELQASSPENEFSDRATVALKAIQAAYPKTKPFPTIAEGAAEESEEALIAEEAENAPVNPPGGAAPKSGGTNTSPAGAGRGVTRQPAETPEAP